MEDSNEKIRHPLRERLASYSRLSAAGALIFIMGYLKGNNDAVVPFGIQQELEENIGRLITSKAFTLQQELRTSTGEPLSIYSLQEDLSENVIDDNLINNIESAVDGVGFMQRALGATLVDSLVVFDVEGYDNAFYMWAIDSTQIEKIPGNALYFSKSRIEGYSAREINIAARHEMAHAYALNNPGLVESLESIEAYEVLGPALDWMNEGYYFSHENPRSAGHAAASPAEMMASLINAFLSPHNLESHLDWVAEEAGDERADFLLRGLIKVSDHLVEYEATKGDMENDSALVAFLIARNELSRIQSSR